MTRGAFVLFVLFVATVAAANLAFTWWEFVPVGFGLEAPAGVYAAGLAFGLRDCLHEAAGRRPVLLAIAAGAAIAYVIEDASTVPGGAVPIAVASAVAFGVSELADLVVYSPLRERWWPAAVAASNTVGAAVDSALFLLLAVGTLEHFAGQMVGKTLMVIPAMFAVWWIRRAVPRYALRPQGA